MSNLIKILLNGIINTTSTESVDKKEIKMKHFTTNIPEIDHENQNLLQAASILEKVGNHPNLAFNDFQAQLLLSDLTTEEQEEITLAAIAIETMMNYDLVDDTQAAMTIH